MNNNHTDNATDDANTVITISPMYDVNASNGNCGNQNVLYLTVNTQVIGDNHIGQNTCKNCICTLTDIMVWMVDNMTEKLVYRNALKSTNARGVVILSETKRKQRNFLKYHCSFF